MAWTRRTKLHHSLWASCEKCGVLELASAAFTLHSGFTGSEIKGCAPVCVSSPSTERMRTGQEKVKANISAEKFTCWVQTALIEGNEWCLTWISEVQWLPPKAVNMQSWIFPTLSLQNSLFVSPKVKSSPLKKISQWKMRRKKKAKTEMLQTRE